MLNIERLDYILKELQMKKAVYVSELAKKYFVSPSTIRRDLNALEKEGLVRRTYGGAILIEHPSSEIPFQVRQNENQAQKNIIGQLAAQLVRDDQFIFLDATSTVAYIVRHLINKNNLKIITTSAQIALDATDQLPSAQIYCTGGWMNSFLRGFVGEAARQRIAEYRPDILFFSARSISLGDGISDVNDADVYMKQQMLESCRKSVFLCDSSKFGKTSYRVLCDIGQIDCLITDRSPSPEWLYHLESAGVEVVFPRNDQTAEPR
ncbi:MAG TPA: DeoR/GlpR family DNA-binding transcription regulator [Limnochordia bacterium]|nr:DeoR/GlpR family DNA-binding transcription regulator [Limnochordia bacterium]